MNEKEDGKVNYFESHLLKRRSSQLPKPESSLPFTHRSSSPSYTNRGIRKTGAFNLAQNIAKCKDLHSPLPSIPEHSKAKRLPKAEDSHSIHQILLKHTPTHPKAKKSLQPSDWSKFRNSVFDNTQQQPHSPLPLPHHQQHQQEEEETNNSTLSNDTPLCTQLKSLAINGDSKRINVPLDTQIQIENSHPNSESDSDDNDNDYMSEQEYNNMKGIAGDAQAALKWRKFLQVYFDKYPRRASLGYVYQYYLKTLNQITPDDAVQLLESGSFHIMRKKSRRKVSAFWSGNGPKRMKSTNYIQHNTVSPSKRKRAGRTMSMRNDKQFESPSKLKKIVEEQDWRTETPKKERKPLEVAAPLIPHKRSLANLPENFYHSEIDTSVSSDSQSESEEESTQEFNPNGPVPQNQTQSTNNQNNLFMQFLPTSIR